MKKIIFLLAHLGGGGAERVSVLLANQFALIGYSVSVIVFNREFSDYKTTDNVKLYYLTHKTVKKKQIFLKIIRLRRILRQINPDAVISLGFSYKYLLFSGILNHYTFILSERSNPNELYTNRLDRLLVDHCLKKARHTVFQTKEAQECFKQSIVDKGVIISNPVSIDAGQALWKQNACEKYVMTACRLHSAKNLEMMIRAFDLFHREHPEYELRIYGEGEMKDELFMLIGRMGLHKHVKLMGPTTDVFGAMRNSAMFLLSSDYEGIPNSMLEALAIGVPCVCTDCPVGGTRMFINDGENGYLVSVGDADAFAGAMHKALHTLSEDQLHQSAENIRRTLSIEVICSKWEDLLM